MEKNSETKCKKKKKKKKKRDQMSNLYLDVKGIWT